MSDYPDPDEEFELMYGDELELIQDHEDEDVYVPVSKSKEPDTQPNNVINAIAKSQDNYQNSPLLFSTQTQSETQRNDTEAPSAVMDTATEDVSNKKRTADDLFGNIDDLELDDFEEQPSKKTKSEDQEKLDLIEHILLLRKLNKEKSNIFSANKSVTKNNADRDKYNMSYRFPKYPFITIKNFNDEKVYLRFHSEQYMKEEVQRIVSDTIGKDVLGETSRSIWNEANELLSKQLAIQLDKQNEDLMDIPKLEENKDLWTDLYRPKKYIELLSNESTNRIMLKWLKLWDQVVFNRKPKLNLSKHTAAKNYFNKFELNTNLDEHGRPQYKVALLCGPPGLGKTTLAHVAAKHAGYNVIEINASDDRSTEAFKTSLENATQMQSVLDRAGRPNCLVFDEIDGAPQTSIDFLVKFINGTATSKPKKGKKQKEFILKRPIICICNDVYVPALRPLRQIAFVINFPQTSTVRLAERLMCISRREQIKTDFGAMMALAEKSNNDIRCCLSVLHFFKGNNQDVRLSDIYKFNIGEKDIQKGLFTVWNEIFQIQRTKPNSIIQQDTTRKQTMNARMSKILHTISSFGDYDRVAQGIYENFPLLKIQDASLSGLADAMEWFIFSDLLSTQINRLQNYTLLSYLPYAFVVWHFLFATSQSQKLKYPSTGYEMRQKEIRRKAVVSEVLKGMQPSIRANCGQLPIILDIVPLLTIIIVPNFRPVSLHLYTKEEKEMMLKVVNIMIDYNLNYIQERMPDGTYVYNLEPNIQELCLEESSTCQRKPLSYFNKQLIAREIELEKMRRFEGPKTNEKSTKQKLDLTKEADKKLPNHLQRLQVKSVKNTKPTVAKDFFGRIINKPTASTEKRDTESDIWYQYKEGYSNAVRKRIKLAML